MTDRTPEPLPSMRIFCNRCSTDTNHVLKANHLQRRDFGDAEWWFESEFRLWICAGCDTATLEERYTDSEIDAPDPYVSTFYPKRAHSDLAKKLFQQLPKTLTLVYGETMKAFNAGLDLLCAAGLRALIDGICSDKHIGGGNLEERIGGLGSLLPKNIVENLHTFRFMGNTALHELTSPKRDDLRLAIEICEDLLNFLYELDYKARRLTASRQGKTIFDELIEDLRRAKPG